jgi:hypothetical protein
MPIAWADQAHAAAARGPGPSILGQVSIIVQIAFFLSTGIVALLSYITARKTIFQPLRVEIFKKQLEDLSLVLKIFVGKGTYDLFEDFAFYDLIDANIAKMYDAYASFAFDSRRPEEQLEYRHELCPSSMVLPEGLVALTGYRVEGVLAKPIKSEEWNYRNYEISLPRKFSENQSELQAVLDSPLLPRSIAAKLEDYLDVVEANASVVREVIDECAKDMPTKYPTPKHLQEASFGWIEHKILRDVKDLEPLADSINNSVRSYFDTDALLPVKTRKKFGRSVGGQNA